MTYICCQSAKQKHKSIYTRIVPVNNRNCTVRKIYLTQIAIFIIPFQSFRLLFSGKYSIKILLLVILNGSISAHFRRICIFIFYLFSSFCKVRKQKAKKKNNCCNIGSRMNIFLVIIFQSYFLLLNFLQRNKNRKKKKTQILHSKVSEMKFVIFSLDEKKKKKFHTAISLL